MKHLRQIVFLAIFPLTALPTLASAWNSPGHMVSSAIAFQVLKLENPRTITKLKAVLENHPGAQTDGNSSSRLLLHRNDCERLGRQRVERC